jgi:BMFP domain-containing protein YqiC
MSDILDALDAALEPVRDRLDRLETRVDALEIRFAAARRLSDTFAHVERDAASSDRVVRGDS